MKNHSLFFSGSSHPYLTQLLSKNFGWAKAELTTFKDKEIFFEIKEKVFQKDIFIFQTLAKEPNHFLMELLIMVDALKRASAKRITAIIPYLAYCRQDRKQEKKVPITAKLVANLLSEIGINQIITCDLHSEQIEGFFDIPVIHISCQKLLCSVVREAFTPSIVVAPDTGSIKIAEKSANYLGMNFAVISKKRLSNQTVTSHLMGEVKGKKVLLIDDILSTGNTLISAAYLCKSLGAKTIIAAVTHALCLEEILPAIKNSPIQKLFCTDSIPQTEPVINSDKIKVVSIAGLLTQEVEQLSSKTQRMENPFTNSAASCKL